MYKRVAKHARKKAEEEALGLDEETKDVLGLNDTDDSESDSSSSDEDNGSSGSDDENASQHDISAKLKRKLGGLYDDGGEEEVSGSQSGAADSATDDDDDDDGGPTAQEALQTPLYKIANPAGSQSCAICPGRIFKNAGMAADHVISAAHIRRHKRFVSSTAALKDNGIDLDTVSAASVAAVMTDKPEFASTKKDSAKSRRKRKRDRGGKKRQEERKNAAPTTGEASSEEGDRTKNSTKVASARAEDSLKQDKNTSRKDKPVLNDRRPVPNLSASHRTDRPAKRLRRESVPKAKVRVVDVQ